MRDLGAQVVQFQGVHVDFRRPVSFVPDYSPKQEVTEDGERVEVYDAPDSSHVPDPFEEWMNSSPQPTLKR